MTNDPPFVPKSRKRERTLRDRIERARKAHEEAVARVTDRYGNVKPDKRRWRTREELEQQPDPLYVR